MGFIIKFRLTCDLLLNVLNIYYKYFKVSDLFYNMEILIYDPFKKRYVRFSVLFKSRVLTPVLHHSLNLSRSRIKN